MCHRELEKIFVTLVQFDGHIGKFHWGSRSRQAGK
jgi:hypothetical protein